MVVIPSVLVALVLAGTRITWAVAGLSATTAVFGGLYLLGRRVKSGTDPLGIGDVAIAALLGAMAGFPGGLIALAAGTVITGAVGLGALVTRRARLGSYLPFGPGLCLGGVVTLCLTPSA